MFDLSYVRKVVLFAVVCGSGAVWAVAGAQQEPLPEGPDAPLNAKPSKDAVTIRRGEPDWVATRPFSSLGVEIALGSEGLGVQVATPLSSRLNLRAGAAGALVNPQLVEDGFQVVGDVKVVGVFTCVDYFPFFYKLHRFHISPGVTVYNGNNFAAVATVPPGQNFDLGYGSFISAPADPIRGDFTMDFGRRVAPRLTFGFGNLIPRRGEHWSIPFEIGAEYLGRQPRIRLKLTGSTCDQDGCYPVAKDSDAQADLAQEQVDLNNNISPMLRFFPVVSLGVGYRFGH